MSSYSGSITELYVSEGSYVNEGDLIARLKSTDLDMQKVPASRMELDCVGHYARPDVLELHVHER